MSDGSTEHIKKFVFTSKYNAQGNPQEEELEVFIPEKRVNWKKSSGNWGWDALPGIVAAKCGAKVIISESALLPKSLAHTKRSCQLNNLNLSHQVQVTGLTWGLLLSNLDNLGPLDIIIGSDCFYDPTVFEDILVTLAYLFEIYPNAKFICSYQERSSDWSIEHLLAKWKLRCQIHDTSTLGQSAGINVLELIGPHSIHILEITKLD
ncbi:hypothetical protein WA026_018945 [Henosepilachna vigintioctopunctata]|uniref:Methyltransferase-like protein 23 n=1 Tax=Henosepilachna vigintioctopunctata TaxID=420089 RepID=A0AAW1UEK4_9CUCU